jgi:hypothetical protein
MGMSTRITWLTSLFALLERLAVGRRCINSLDSGVDCLVRNLLVRSPVGIKPHRSASGLRCLVLAN